MLHHISRHHLQTKLFNLLANPEIITNDGYVDVAILDEFLVASDDKDIFVHVIITFVARMSPSIAHEICRFC